MSTIYKTNNFSILNPKEVSLFLIRYLNKFYLLMLILVSNNIIRSIKLWLYNYIYLMKILLLSKLHVDSYIVDAIVAFGNDDGLQLRKCLAQGHHCQFLVSAETIAAVVAEPWNAL